MININLLIKPPPQVRWRLMIWIATGAGLLGVAGIAAYAAIADGQALELELAQTKQLMEDYNRVSKQLPEVQNQMDQVESQLKGLAQIERNQRFRQSAVVKAFLATPPNLWVSSITFSPSEVTISGQTNSFDSAMQYLAALRASPLVQSVTEKSVRTIESGATAFTYLVYLRGEVKP